MIADIFYKIAFAQTSARIVPCDSCTFKDFWQLLSNIFGFLIILVVPLAILGIGIGGVYMILGSANESQRTQGKEIFWASVIGLILAAASWVIVNTILTSLGATGFSNPLK